ncbi:MAG: hypothetical protein ACJ0F4_02235 [Gammaproteobacteria bacterium]
MVWIVIIIYSLIWVYLGEKLLMPLEDKWAEKVDPILETYVGVIGKWIVKGIMAFLVMFMLWFLPVMWIIERF